MAAFSKGSRICIGNSLAMLELNMALASIVRRFKLKDKLFDKLETRDFFGTIIDTPVQVVFARTED
jgi:cytochrome P450